jgi:hypothetical protein
VHYRSLQCFQPTHHSNNFFNLWGVSSTWASSTRSCEVLHPQSKVALRLLKNIFYDIFFPLSGTHLSILLIVRLSTIGLKTSNSNNVARCTKQRNLSNQSWQIVHVFLVPPKCDHKEFAQDHHKQNHKQSDLWIWNWLFHSMIKGSLYHSQL